MTVKHLLYWSDIRDPYRRTACGLSLKTDEALGVYAALKFVDCPYCQQSELYAEIKQYNAERDFNLLLEEKYV